MHAATTHLDPHADPIAAFNAELAAAKQGALQILQDLIRGLTDPASPVSATLRELRLLATAILRTQPMKPSTSPPSNAPSTPRTPAPSASPSPTKPDQRPSIFNPVRRAAINDVRDLIAKGNRAIIDAVLVTSPAHPPHPPAAVAPARPPPMTS